VLREENVVSEIKRIVKQMQNSKPFENFVLIGGTALAIQLEHRTSTDIDFLSKDTIRPDEIINYLNDGYTNIKEDISSNNYMKLFINDIKVEIINKDEKYLEEPKYIDGIKLLGIKDIAAMKLNAILSRKEARDFIDIAYLLQGITLKKMFELYKEKYGMISPLYMKRTLLTKSKSIKDNEWLVGIKLLRSDIEPKNIPVLIENEIEKYNRDINVGKTE